MSEIINKLAIEKMIEMNLTDKPVLASMEEDCGFLRYFIKKWIQSERIEGESDGEVIFRLGCQSLGAGLYIGYHFGLTIQEKDLPRVIEDVFGEEPIFYFAIESLGTEDSEALTELYTDFVLGVLTGFIAVSQTSVDLAAFMESMFNAGLTIAQDMKAHPGNTIM